MVDRNEKTENAIQNVILVIVGIAAGIVSFKHVHDWTVMYGQPSPVGLVNAGVTELIQIAAGVEIKRRRRAGRVGWRAFWFPVGVLLFSCGTSLIAQLSQAGPGWQGKLTATLPMIGFLIVVKIVMGRTPITVPAVPEQSRTTVPAEDSPDLDPGTAPDQSPQVDPVLIDEPDPDPGPSTSTVPGQTRTIPDVSAPSPTRHPDPVPDPVQAALDLIGPKHVRPTRPGPRPVPATASTPGLDPDLVDAARVVFDHLRDRGQRPTRDRLAAELRDRGHRVRTDTAGALLRHCKELVPA